MQIVNANTLKVECCPSTLKNLTASENISLQILKNIEQYLEKNKMNFCIPNINEGPKLLKYFYGSTPKFYFE